MVPHSSQTRLCSSSDTYSGPQDFSLPQPLVSSILARSKASPADAIKHLGIYIQAFKSSQPATVWTTWTRYIKPASMAFNPIVACTASPLQARSTTQRHYSISWQVNSEQQNSSAALFANVVDGHSYYRGLRGHYQTVLSVWEINLKACGLIILKDYRTRPEIWTRAHASTRGSASVRWSD